MAWTSMRRATHVAAVFIGAILMASCGGGDAPAGASASPGASAPPVSAAFKGKDTGRANSSTALVPGPLSLLAAPGVGSPDDAGPNVLLDGSIVRAYATHVVDLSANLVHDSLLTQRYDPGGLAIGDPVEVATYVLRYWSNPGSVHFGRLSVLPLSDGDYLVVWVIGIVSSRSQTGPVYETYAQRYDSAGNPLGARRQLARIYEAWGSRVGSLTALNDGGYLVEVRRSDPPNPTTVNFVPVDSIDRTVPILAASVDYSQVPIPSLVLPLAHGGYLRLASDGSSNAQILDNNGTIVATAPVHPGTPYALADGSFAVAWVDAAAAAGASPVLVQRYDLLGNAMGEPTRAGPPAPLRPPYFAGTSLNDVGLALTFYASDAAGGAIEYSQLLHEADPSRQQLVGRCRAAARDLAGSEHRQFMSRCLRAGGSR